MPVKQLCDAAIIAGVGETEYVRGSPKSERQLTLEAGFAACVDAGVLPEEVDGLVIPMGRPKAEDFLASLGMPDLHFHCEVSMGGASPAAGVLAAAGAIASGLATTVLVATGWKGYSGGPAGPRLGSGDAALSEDWLGPGADIRMNLEYPHGMNVPMQWYSLHANRWFYETQADPAGMATVAIETRKHANRNSAAIFRQRELSYSDYWNSSYLVRPFRLFDICLETDGAAAVLVSEPSRSTQKHKDVFIAGGGEGHPDDADDLIRRRDILNMGIAKAAPRALAMAGITLDEVDFAEIYDCFTFIVLRQLEEIGFCERGEGPAFVADGRISLDGQLPLNTHGGLLSQAHVDGMNHIVEAVRQLRGDAGRAQVRNAHIGLVTGYGDFGDGSMLVLHN